MLRGWWRSAIGTFVMGFVLSSVVFNWGGVFPAARSTEPAPPAVSAAPERATCPDAYGRFVGVYEGRVAVYAGNPGGCRVLLSVESLDATALPSFLQQDLHQGIVYHRDDELFQIFEGLTVP